MTRWIAASASALALSLTLGLTMPLGNQAVADGVEAAPVYRPVFTRKKCIAPARRWSWSMAGPTTWVCKAEEKCCYDRLLRKGSCLSATQRCF